MGKRVRGGSPFRRFLAAGAAVAGIALVAPVAWSPSIAKSAAAAPSDGEIGDFYRARGGAALWFAPNAGPAAPQLIQLLATAEADHLNPRRYNVRSLQRAVADAQTGN